jgi:hypothetical protein
MTAPGLTLVQELALWKLFTEELDKRRSETMVPQSRDEMPPGSHIAAMFGGRIAAWVTMPQGSQPAAYVEDKGAFLAWVKTNYPEKLRDTVKIAAPHDELIVHLAEHWPEALENGFEPDPQWVEDILKSLKDPGHYRTGSGENLTKDNLPPGITIPDRKPPNPSVFLEKDALEVVGDARRAGLLPVLGDLLALPPGGES